MSESSDEEDCQNVVATLRQEAGLSPAQLAEKARVSIAAVRRMEHRRLVRMADAIAVARALGKAAAMVFEPAFQIIESGDSRQTRADGPRLERRRVSPQIGQRRDRHSPGVLDVEVHFVGGATRCWPLFSSEVDRFWKHLERNDRSGPCFFAFHGDEISVAFNLSEMAHAHALYDPVEPSAEEEDDDRPGVEVLLSGEREWLAFGADFDQPETNRMAIKAS